MRFSLIPIFLLMLPMAEIATFIFVGREIGIGATLALILLSCLAGAILLRVQGLGVLRKLQSASRTGENPGRQIVHGAMIVIAAFLLILPGFLTDIAGLLLFIPAVREGVWQFVRNKVAIVTRTQTQTQSAARGRGPSQPPRTIPGVIDLGEAEFSRDAGQPDDDDRLR